MRPMVAHETGPWPLSRAEYDRLIAPGVFRPEDRIELIGGQLMVAEPRGAPHYTAVVKTARALAAAFGEGWYVRSEGPIGLDDDSEPEPDVAVVPGTPDDYSREHPSRPVLTVADLLP
jgi:Uma2 family endonuclease